MSNLSFPTTERRDGRRFLRTPKVGVNPLTDAKRTNMSCARRFILIGNECSSEWFVWNSRDQVNDVPEVPLLRDQRLTAEYIMKRKSKLQENLTRLMFESFSQICRTRPQMRTSLSNRRAACSTHAEDIVIRMRTPRFRVLDIRHLPVRCQGPGTIPGSGRLAGRWEVASLQYSCPLY
jgi:hypothetical protein